jgi:L-iditol 2-dehydrogenase
MQRLVLDELELVGCRATAGEMRHVMPLVEQGRMRVRGVTTHHFALADYGQALATFNDPASGAIKIIIEP